MSKWYVRGTKIQLGLVTAALLCLSTACSLKKEDTSKVSVMFPPRSQSALSSSLRTAERQLAEILDNEKLTAPETESFKQLTLLHDKLSMAGTYQFIQIKVLSLMTPFGAPVAATLITHFFGKSGGN